MKNRISTWITLLAAAMAAPATLQAANLYWDTSTSAGVQNAGGTWGTDNFWTTDGTTLTAWGGKADSAFFGGSGTAPLVATPAGDFTITVSGTQEVSTIWQQLNSVGNFTFTGGSLNANAVRIDGGSATVNSVLVDNGGSDISFTARSGLVTVTLGGDNTFSQNVTIAGNTDGGGKILLNHQNALGSGNLVTFTHGSHIDLNGYDISGKDIANNRRGGLFNTGATKSVWSGNVSLEGSGTTHIFTAGGTGAEVEISGVISSPSANASTHSVRAIDNSVLRLTGNNTYEGSTILRPGSTLIVGHTNALGSTSGVLIDTGATLDLNGFDVGSKAVTLQKATSRLVNDDTSNAAGTSGNISILLNQATSQIGGDGDLSLGGVISSAATGGFTKVGTGTLTLGGINTYTGTTTVNAGTLVVSGSGVLSRSTDIVVDGGAELSLQADSVLNTGAMLDLDETAAFDLDFSGTQIVTGVSLDGGTNWLAAGTYDAAQLSSLNASGTYTGAGSVEVFQPDTLEISGDTVSMNWIGDVGVSYAVESSLDLVGGIWTTVASNLVGNGGWLIYTSATEAVEFLKIVAQWTIADHGNAMIAGTIAARLSAAAGNAPTNIVLSADGVYNVGTTLNVPAGVTLERHANCNAIIRATPALDNGILIRLNDGSELVNLIVDGNHEAHTLVMGRSTDSVAIKGGGYRNTKNDYTTASASPWLAWIIDLGYSTNAWIEDAKIFNSGEPKNTTVANWSGGRLGINLDGSDDATVVGVTVSNTLGGGISVAASKGTIIADCTIEQVGRQNSYGAKGAADGVVGYHCSPSFGRRTKSLLITNCTIRNFRNHGIHVDGDDIRITDNIITGTTGWFPIYVGDYKQPPDLSSGISIHGNYIEGLADPQGCIKLENFSWEGFSLGDVSPNRDYATGTVLNEVEHVMCSAQDHATENHKNHTLAEFNGTKGVFTNTDNIIGLGENASTISGALSSTNAYLDALDLDAKIRMSFSRIRCDEAGYVNLRMYLSAGAAGGKVRMLWGTTQYNGIDSSSGRLVELDAVEGWYTYKFRVEDQAQWAGYLDDIRIYPCHGKGNISFEIDFIRLTKVDPSLAGFNDDMELFVPGGITIGNYQADQLLLKGTTASTSAFISRENFDANMTAPCQFANTSNNIACDDVDFVSVRMKLPTDVGSATVDLLWGNTVYQGIFSGRRLQITAQPGWFTYNFPVGAKNHGWAGFLDDLRFHPCNGQSGVPFEIESFQLSKKDPSIGGFTKDRAQWQACGNISNYVTHGLELRGTVTTTANAFIYSNDIDSRLNAVGIIDHPELTCHIPCADVNYVSMKMWLPSGVADGKVRFLWGTTHNPGISSSRSIDLDAKADWNVYTFNVDEQAGWTGSLDDVRIYPCDGKSNIFFRIGYIILSEDEPTRLY